MSATIVKEIIDNFKAEIAILLPDHAQATNIFDVERNPYANKTKLYGVRPLGSVRVEGATRYITKDQDIEVIFIDNYANITHKDEPQQAIVLKQFEYEETISTALECGKLGLGGKVLSSRWESTDEPEFFEELNLSVLRVTYTIKYRSVL